MDAPHLCHGCMSEKGDAEVCPACGWDDTQVQGSPLFLPPGTILSGRYLIGRVLGYGGFGVTYLGWDINLQIKLAIKEYFPQNLATRTSENTGLSIFTGDAQSQFGYGLDKFIEEARTLAKLNNHPGVVSISDFFKENNTAYFVMNYMEGITLKDYLDQKGGKLSCRDAVEIMTPIMDALREVHGMGILHRDVSPDNIYITSTKQVKLLDFGAARYAVSEHSHSLSVILKPGYAPMEQYYTKGLQGPWTDVYGVAATIYRVVTGEVPPEALERNEEEILVPPSGKGVEISPALEEVLLKALAVKAKDRFQTIKEFQDAVAGERAVPRANAEQTAPVEGAVSGERRTGSEQSIQPEPKDESKSKRSSGWAVFAIAGIALVFLLGTIGAVGYFLTARPHGLASIGLSRHSEDAAADRTTRPDGEPKTSDKNSKPEGPAVDPDDEGNDHPSDREKTEDKNTKGKEGQTASKDDQAPDKGQDDRHPIKSKETQDANTPSEPKNGTPAATKTDKNDEIPKNAIIVSQDGKGDYSTVGAAVRGASGGMKILIKPGTYREKVVIAKNIELIGDGPAEDVRIQGEDGIVVRSASVTLRNLTICTSSKQVSSGGDSVSTRVKSDYLKGYQSIRDSQGIGVSQGRLVLENCIIQSAGQGVVASDNSKCEIINCSIRNCGFGVIAVASRCSIRNTTFSKFDEYGIYVADSGTVSISNLTIASAKKSDYLVEPQGTFNGSENETDCSVTGRL